MSPSTFLQLADCGSPDWSPQPPALWGALALAAYLAILFAIVSESTLP